MGGTADLPLHSGSVPPWLYRYMRELARALIKVLVEEAGPSEVVRRLSDPLWFQAFNNVIGMDWDSSGSTTVVLRVLKEVSWSEDLGLLVLGGKGAESRRVPEESLEASERLGLGEDFGRSLRLASYLGAKMDSVLLQDGHQVYIHGLIVSEDGLWTMVQQGMNVERGYARRYHISSESFAKAPSDPHSGLASNIVTRPLNMFDRESLETIKTIEDLVAESASKILRNVQAANACLKGLRTLDGAACGGRSRSFSIPYYRPVRISRELLDTINRAQIEGARKIMDILKIRGFGAEALRALALVADLIYGNTPSNRDPVTHPVDPFRYSYAHGGKDGIPYRVRRDLVERTIVTLEEAVERARVGDKERLEMLRRLSRYSHLVLRAGGP